VRLERMSRDVLSVEEGSLYPALYRMERRGWLASAWSVTETGRRARFYTLTKAGRSQLDAETASWMRLTTAVADVLNG
jgi:transcriptional regulator